MDRFSSKLLDDAIDAFASLPGIGRKTATRLVLHLLKQDRETVNQFGEAFIRLRQEVQYCNTCYNISETPHCHICSNTSRDAGIICVVEDIRDVIAIENTRQYNGLYHVLGGKISPMEGVGPSDLHIDALVNRSQLPETTEVLLALSTTMEGDTTNFYIFRKIQREGLHVSTIARGIAFGDELEYTDEITLGRSILQRIPYEKGLRG